MLSVQSLTETWSLWVCSSKYWTLLPRLLHSCARRNILRNRILVRPPSETPDTILKHVFKLTICSQKLSCATWCSLPGSEADPSSPSSVEVHSSHALLAAYTQWSTRDQHLRAYHTHQEHCGIAGPYNKMFSSHSRPLPNEIKCYTHHWRGESCGVQSLTPFFPFLLTPASWYRERRQQKKLTLK